VKGGPISGTSCEGTASEHSNRLTSSVPIQTRRGPPEICDDRSPSSCGGRRVDRFRKKLPDRKGWILLFPVSEHSYSKFSCYSVSGKDIQFLILILSTFEEDAHVTRGG